MEKNIAPNGKPSNLTEGNSNSFMKWYAEWYKGISNKMNIVFSLPSVIAPYKEENVVVLDVFEKINQNIDAKTYLKEIVEKADEYGVVIYLEPTPRHNRFQDNLEKKKKITKEYLIEYYKRFGFQLTTNNQFMKRLPKSNPDIRYDEGGRVEHLIREGIVDLKMYDTTPEHAKEYGLKSINPLYIQTICVSEPKRLKGLGKKVLAYIEKYAIENGHDVVFGHITQKAEFTKDERETLFCDIDMIKNWLSSKGYAINDDNNDFHKFISHRNPDIRYKNGGTMESIGNGGITYGKSHAEGGIKVYNKGTGQMLEVEGGESVVNKKTMAMKDKVDLNGEKMTPCEAISELNQMGGGVAFECSDVEGKKYKMADGGELQKGIKQEMEHAKTFEKLYRHKITPKEAPAEIAKEHLMEDEDYYKDLRKIRHSCSCQKHRRKMMDGGIFDKGFGSLDSFMENFEKKMDEDEKKEIIDETISVGREMLDHDYKSVIMERIEPSLQKYFAHLNHANLYKSGWRLQFGTSKRWAGLCSSKPKTNEKGIFISIDFVKHDKNWLQNYKDVVYHEMAHAMVVQFIPQVNSIDPFHEGQEGHGMVWTNVCKALNPEGVCERYYKNSNFAESFKDYMYSCRTCGAKKYGNTRAFTDICFKCKSPVIVVRNK